MSQMTGGMSRMGLMSLRRDRSVLNHKVKAGTAKRMLTFATPYRKILGVFLFAVVFGAVIAAINPLVIRAIIDRGIAHHNSTLVIWLGIFAGVLALLDAGVNLVDRYISATIGEGLIFDMRAKVFRHIQSMPIAFFTRTQTGALISRLNNDIIGAQQAFTDLLSNMVGNVIGVAIVLVFMTILSWQITVVALLLLPLFLIPARLVARRLGTMMRNGFDLNAQMNMIMNERFNVSGAMLVKLFGNPKAEADAFEDRAGQVRDIGVAQATYSRIFFVALGLTSALATVIVWIVGGVKAADGVIQVGTLVALTAYLGQLYGPLTQLSNLNLDVMTTLVSFERLFEILDLKPMITESESPRQVPAGAVGVSFTNVTFTYPSPEEVSLASLEAVAVLESSERRQVLHGLNLVVAPGTMTALVGPSGAGKTTISALIPRLYDVTGGAVTIGDIDVRDLSFESLRDTVGVVSQDPHLFHDTLRSNLAYVKPDATDAELFAALERAQILPLIQSLPDGLNTLVGERGYRLSGGEKQRVALARLLLKAPRVVVLDEATAHLDSESEAAVQRALEETLEGRTSIVIAHRLSTVRNADQIAVIDAGVVRELGTHDELLAQGGLYADLFHTQFGTQDL